MVKLGRIYKISNQYVLICNHHPDGIPNKEAIGEFYSGFNLNSPDHIMFITPEIIQMQKWKLVEGQI